MPTDAKKLALALIAKHGANALRIAQKALRESDGMMTGWESVIAQIKVMNGANASRGPGDRMTDEELIRILDEPSWTWVIAAGGRSVMSPGSLRTALSRARVQTEHGAKVTDVTRLPGGGVVISAAQLLRLWTHLGWLPN